MDSVQAIVKLTLTPPRNSRAASPVLRLLPAPVQMLPCLRSILSCLHRWLYTLHHHFSSVQSLSRVRLFATPRIPALSKRLFNALHEGPAVRIGFTPGAGGASIRATASPLPWLPPRPSTRYRLQARKPSRCRRRPLAPRGPRRGNWAAATRRRCPCSWRRSEQKQAWECEKV